MVDVLTLIPPNHGWQKISQTEIVEKSQNPLFMKTIGLGDASTPVKTRIRLIVYDVKELVSGTVCLLETFRRREQLI